MENRVRFGIMGAAGIAKAAVIPAIFQSGKATATAIATRNPSTIASWAEQSGIATVYGSYEALLSDHEIEAVYIPLPNSEHAHWTMAAARAGKAVLCEKPLALNATDAEAVVHACEHHGVPLMEGFMYRFHPQHARVRAIIDSGAIGEVVEVHAHLSVDLMSPADPSNVRFDRRLGGGALLDMGCYVVHIARSVFGQEPLDVSARWSVHEEYGVDVATSAILSFTAGKTALVSCSFRGNAQGFYRVIGRRGQIDVPRGIIPGLGDRVSETLVIVIDDNGHRREEQLLAVDQYRLMIDAFSDAVRGNRSVLPPIEDPIRNMRVLDAMAISARSGLVTPVA
jgi:predicted dehydrogenase